MRESAVVSAYQCYGGPLDGRTIETEREDIDILYVRIVGPIDGDRALPVFHTEPLAPYVAYHVRRPHPHQCQWVPQKSKFGRFQNGQD